MDKQDTHFRLSSASCFPFPDTFRRKPRPVTTRAPPTPISACLAHYHTRGSPASTRKETGTLEAMRQRHESPNDLCRIHIASRPNMQLSERDEMNARLIGVTKKGLEAPRKKGKGAARPPEKRGRGLPAPPLRAPCPRWGRTRPARARRPVLPRTRSAVLWAMAGLAAEFGMGSGDPRLRGRARAGRPLRVRDPTGALAAA